MAFIKYKMKWTNFNLLPTVDLYQIEINMQKQQISGDSLH